MSKSSARAGRSRIGLLIAIATICAALVFLAAGCSPPSSSASRKRRTACASSRSSEDTTDPAAWGVNWAREYDDYKRTSGKRRRRALADRRRCPTRRPAASRGSRACLPATRLRLIIATAVDTPTCCRTRSRRGASPNVRSPVRACSVTRRSFQPIDGSVPVMSSRGLKRSASCRPPTLTPVVKTGSMNPVAGGTSGDLHAQRRGTPGQLCRLPRSENMELRVTRPGFIRGIQALASGTAAVPHIESIERWRKGARTTAHDPNTDASRQKCARSCAASAMSSITAVPRRRCSIPGTTASPPIRSRATTTAGQVPDGHTFYDWTHAETGANVLKAQHPEFEL